MIETELHIGCGHPAFEGHFPGRPILPGVVLLCEVIRAIEAQTTEDFVLRHELASVKFLKSVGPGARLLVRVDRGTGHRLTFSVSENGQPVAAGSFVPATQD